jgi:hypothetical protein
MRTEKVLCCIVWFRKRNGEIGDRETAGRSGCNNLKAVRETELTSAERAICSLVYAFGSEDEEIQKD